MSGDSSGSDCEDDVGTGTVDLTVERCRSWQATGSVPKKNLSECAKSGMSATRIKAAVLQPKCSCLCRLPVKILFHLCMAFWSLTKPTQDALLWGIQHEAGGQKRKQWYLQGQQT